MAINNGFGPGSDYRFSTYRHGSLDGRNSNFRYPSQWWDIAHMELPNSIKGLFKWCRYHALVNPLISSVVKKLSAYPITKITVADRAVDGFDKNRERWQSLLHNSININRFQIEAGLDYHTYGNAIISIYFPFYKYLECKSCGQKDRIKKLKFGVDWEFKNFDYILNCKECKNSGPANVDDVFYKSHKDIKLIRWNPTDIEIDYNPITQRREYAYTIPPKIRNHVLTKKLSYLEELPAKFIESMKKNQPVILSPDNVFHFKAETPSLNSNDEGWGYPIILPALKDSFYLQIMKKAQEAVMLEHLVPLDIIFPATQDQNASPYTTVNLSDWKRKIEQELTTWRMDPNHKPILPLPVGYQRIGGNGRALMLTQEIRAHSEHILIGMGVPQEFVFGGLSWTGSSVSLRMLENMFMTYRDMHTQFIENFLVPNIARFMGWQTVSIKMKSFKMADDVQNKQLLLSLNNVRKVSDRTLLSEFDIDSFEEMKIIERELRRNLEITKLDSLYKAQIQGESQQVMMKAQTEASIQQQKATLQAQKEMQEQQGRQAAQAQQQQPQQPQQQEQVNAVQLAEAWAKKLSGMDSVQAQQYLDKMSAQSPQLHELVMQKMQQLKAGGASGAMKPMPEKGPPRRGPGTASI